MENIFCVYRPLDEGMKAYRASLTLGGLGAVSKLDQQVPQSGSRSRHVAQQDRLTP